MEWISVEDRLPDKRDIYLVYSDGQIALGDFDSDNRHWHVQPYCNTWYYSKSLVTYWMPLPEPPKKQEPRFSFETVEDGYVIYRRGKKLTPWYLTDSLNGDPFSLFIFLTGLDNG